MLDLSFSKKNLIWGGIGILSAFLVGGFFVSLFATGLLLFSSAFYWIANKINNNMILIGVILLLFSLMSLIFHGPYLTGCFFVLFFVLLLSFNALYILVKDLVVALWLVLVVLIGFSFLSSNFQTCATMAWLASIVLISILKTEKSKTNIKNLFCYIQNSMTWFDLLTCLLVLLSTVLLGFYIGGRFWPLDFHHPIYELSIGQSYKNAFLNAQDLSYSGKLIRFHFLSTQIPFYFSHILGVSLLDAVYMVSIVFFTFLTFLLVPSFLNYYPQFKTPLFFVFFIPSFTFEFDCLYKFSIISTGSFFLAFLFMVCALYFLIQKKYWLLLICASMLLLIKASFFMSLCGGIFIFWLRQRDLIVKFLLKIMPFCLIFLLANYLFLSGAHAHALWVLMPSFLFHYTTGCRIEAILGILIFACALYLLIKEKELEIQGLVAIIISGLLGWFLITELIEGNSYQFVRAVYFPLAIFMWALINQKFDSIVFYGYVNNAKEFLYKVFFVCIALFSFSTAACVLSCPFSLTVDAIRCSSRFSYTQKLIQAYSWLNKNISHNSVVLFGFHYDSIESIRSAVSGKQMLCEAFKTRGILMEKDFVPRVANIIRFYKYFVNYSGLSKELMSSFESTECSDIPGTPLSQSQAFSVRMLHYLSLGKEWHLINRSKQVRFELKQALKKDFSQEDALNFIRQAKITHIVLENGDKPSDFLKEISREIYNEGGFCVLEVFIK